MFLLLGRFCTRSMKIFGVCSFMFSLHICLPLVQCDASRILSNEERKIAEKYIQELSDKSSSWVDPYDMFADELSVIETSRREEETKPEVTKNENVNSKTTEHRVSADVDAPHSDEIKPMIALHQQPLSDTEVNHKKSTKDCLLITKEDTCVSGDYIFIKRWLKKFLNKVKNFIPYRPSWRMIVSFTLTDKHVSEIKNILENSKLNIMDVEPQILDIFDDATISDTKSWFSLPFVSFHFLTDERFMFFTALLVIVVVIMILSRYFLYPRWLFYLILAVISVGFQWKLLYEEAIAKKAAVLDKVNYPVQCRNTDLSILNSITHYIKSYFISSGSCEEYYKAVMVNPLWEANLLKAISLTFSKFIFAPLEALAQTLNIFLKELFSDLPPVTVAIVSFFGFCVLIMYCNYKIRFPFFFGSIEPATPAPAITHTLQSDNLTGSLLRKSVNVVSDEVRRLVSDDTVMVEQSSSNLNANIAPQFTNNSKSALNANLCTKCNDEVVQDKVALLENSAVNGGGAVFKVASATNSTNSALLAAKVIFDDSEKCVDTQEPGKSCNDSEENLDANVSSIAETILKSDLLLAENESQIECFDSTGDCRKCSIKSNEMKCSETEGSS